MAPMMAVRIGVLARAAWRWRRLASSFKLGVHYLIDGFGGSGILFFAPLSGRRRAARYQSANKLAAPSASATSIEIFNKNNGTTGPVDVARGICHVWLGVEATKSSSW